jgi:hypothetical protein
MTGEAACSYCSDRGTVPAETAAYLVDEEVSQDVYILLDNMEKVADVTLNFSKETTDAGCSLAC